MNRTTRNITKRPISKYQRFFTMMYVIDLSGKFPKGSKRVILLEAMNVIYLDRYRKSKVLVAAADKDIAGALCEFFLSNEFKVELADTFDKILPTLSKKGVDLVLLTSFGMASSQIPPLVTKIKDAYPGIGITVL